MKKLNACICAMLLPLIALKALAGPGNHTVSLNGKWNLSYWKQPEQPVISPVGIQKNEVQTIEATVPGTVELDLLSAGLIKDPMVGNQVNELRKWEEYQWCYAKSFKAPRLEKGQRYQLFFGGIDCLADIWLNGKHIGSAENMLIEHTFDVTDEIKPDAENLVQVIIRSAVLEGQNYFLGSFSIGNFPSEESTFIRKAPHMYGWDILPRLVSAGLWRKVELRTLEATRFRDVHYIVAGVDTATRNVRLYIDAQLKMPFEKFDKVKAVYTLSRNGKEAYKGSTIVVSPAFRYIMELKNADLWWPRGYGEPALYEAKVELVEEDGTVLSTDTKRIGLRTVQLERTDINLPESPGKFSFIVNGEPIFIHGTNWVPLDALHSRDELVMDKAIEMAVDLNCNMIRCWGGNVYEDHHFFDLCDQNGILVWQDFAMGCTFYPQRTEFTGAIGKEVISVVCKLRNHPSLALWSGNNEDDIALRWSLQPFNLDPNRDAITRKVIPSVLYEFDPTRPYLPSSPYISEAVYQKGCDEKYWPENHLWGPRGYYKDPFYIEAECTFVSEIGYHGCPNLESLKKMMTEDCVSPWIKEYEWNDEWVTKSVRRFPAWGKTYDRNNLMINQVRLLFGEVPSKLEDFIFASQSVQAEAMKYFIEMWRGNKWNKTGIIWWNLRDGWPLISDAIVDYYNAKKMAYYFIRNVQQDVCVFINDAKDGNHPLVVVNDTRHACEGEAEVTDVATGKTVFKGEFHVPANGKTHLSSLPWQETQGIWLIRYKIGDRKFANHYLYGKAPFKLAEYKRLLQKTNLYTVK